MTSPNSLVLDQLELGPMQNYIYLISDPETGEGLVVDPAWDVDQIRQVADKKGIQIKGALITHGHPDHTNGIDDLLSTHDIPVYVSQDEAPYYKPIGENVKSVKSGDKIQLGHHDITCLHTPGHTPGSQCFLMDNRLVAGDTMFIDGCGRCDLPGGDAETMYDTLYNRLMKLPDDTVIYPGHNYHPKSSDTLGNQKQTNPYLTCHNLNQFLSERMGF